LNAKSLTIGGAVVLLLTTWLSRVTGLVTDDQLLFAFFALLSVTLSAALSYLISWSVTGGYKKYNWPPNRWKEQAIKRKVFKVAWFTGGGFMAAFGSIVLICATTGKMLAVYAIVWTILSVMVGATSPGLWSFVFDNVLPRLKQWARGSKPVIHYDESGNVTKATDDGKTVFTGENEALDRESEAKRVMHGD
jgi:hypothetical protein